MGLGASFREGRGWGVGGGCRGTVDLTLTIRMLKITPLILTSKLPHHHAKEGEGPILMWPANRFINPMRVHDPLSTRWFPAHTEQTNLPWIVDLHGVINRFAGHMRIGPSFR